MRKALGIDVGSNSIGWAFIIENQQTGGIEEIVHLGSRIFNKSVEDNTPTPKNQKRRQMRLTRRVLERRARRKHNMMHYLVKQRLLPAELAESAQPEIPLNKLGDPYELRSKALNQQLTPHQFGRVLLHFVARRGFLSSKKSVLGDLMDDPDIQVYLEEIEAHNTSDKTQSAQEKEQKKEEGQFKAEIDQLRERITQSGARTLGEYLFKYGQPNKRNRAHNADVLRTDRAMYREELQAIWAQQQQYFTHLPDDFVERIEKIIFYQRPLKLKKDRIGICSLEPKKYRAKKPYWNHSGFGICKMSITLNTMMFLKRRKA